MDDNIDRNRRSFLRSMMMAATQLGILSTGNASGGESRQFEALSRATAWLNSPPLSASTLAGKIVLVQFGTYTCINWLRTLPHVRAWVHKYRQRLVIVGVHTPEFAFEKDLENVRLAVRQLSIDHPLAVDNDYSIWNAFNNRYWPALYFIDAHGRIRDRHFGEGEYERSERTIQRLLMETGVTAGDSRIGPVTAAGLELPADWRNLRSPEIYLGSDRTENFSSPGGAAMGRRRTYAIPQRLQLNQWALSGEWVVANQAATLSGAGGHIVCRFHARDVHLVMGPLRKEARVRFRVSVDGRPAGPARGVDVDDNGAGTVAEQRLYQLLRQHGPIVDRTFDIEFVDAGVEAFAFTFG